MRSHARRLSCFTAGLAAGLALVACGPGGQASGTGTGGSTAATAGGSTGARGSTTGGAAGSNGRASGSSSGARSSSTGGSGSSTGGGTSGGAGSGGCVPSIPSLAWTSPYAGFSRGLPSDPSFFPIAVWLQGDWHATEMAGLGINVYVGNNAGTDPITPDGGIPNLQAAGIYAILGQDSVGETEVDDPTVVGWWMSPDEPDNAQPNGSGGYGPPVDPSVLVSQYQSYQEFDSTRPIYLGLGQGVAYAAYEGRGSNPPAESGYVPASDIISFDIYPYNNCAGDANDAVTCAEFWLNAYGVDQLHSWSNRGQAAWTDIETTVINAGTTDGPTPQQTTSEVWLSLIHGANGIEYFVDSWNPSFREDAIFESADMVSAVTALDQQIESLAPELNSAEIPGVVSVATSGPEIDMSVKANGTSLYVFAAVARAGTATGSFTIAGMTGNGTATVIGEGRTLPVTAGAFSDAFAANAVHLYQIDLSAVTCP
ncbi:MAG TPA: hypothetical protein VMB50_21085 [Myxococcales bacterium]|nr:hypothetical protein [Myxococcales bacterium]